jgi:hypothetical protein
MGDHAGTLDALTTQNSKSMQVRLEHEKDRLKLLLDMTNTLVLNLEPRDLLRDLGEHTARHSLRLRWGMAS